jgi:hypothetical protein
MKNIQTLFTRQLFCTLATTALTIAASIAIASTSVAAPNRRVTDRNDNGGAVTTPSGSLHIEGEDAEVAVAAPTVIQRAPPTMQSPQAPAGSSTVVRRPNVVRLTGRNLTSQTAQETVITPGELSEEVRKLMSDLKELVANSDNEFGGGKLLKEDVELVEDDAIALKAAVDDIAKHLKNAVLGKQLLRSTLKGFLREATRACPSLPCNTADFDREEMENLLNIAKDYQKESQGYYDRIYRSLFMVAGSAAVNMDLCASRECVRTIWGLYHALSSKALEAFGQEALELKNVAKWSPFLFVNWRRNHPSYFFSETLDETINSIWPANEFVTPGNGVVMTIRTAVASAYTSVEGWFADIYDTLKNARLARFQFKLRPIRHDVVFTEIERLAAAKNEILPTKQLLMRQDLEEDPGDGDGGGDGDGQVDVPLAMQN